MTNHIILFLVLNKLLAKVSDSEDVSVPELITLLNLEVNLVVVSWEDHSHFALNEEVHLNNWLSFLIDVVLLLNIDRAHH